MLDEARWWFEQTGGSLGEYLRWVSLRVDNDDRSNITTDETDDDAVHILTVHAAKGLEFPVVIAAGLGRTRPAGEQVRARFDPDAPVELKMGRLATAGWDSSGDRLAGELEAARLAYVACTRAEDHLVVCLHRVATRTKGKNSAAEMDDHVPDAHRIPLELIEPAEVPTPPITELDDRVDRPDARPIEWHVRSSWSATSLRQRIDDAPTAVEVEPALDAPPDTTDTRLPSLEPPPTACTPSTPAPTRRCPIRSVATALGSVGRCTVCCRSSICSNRATGLPTSSRSSARPRRCPVGSMPT